VRVDLPAAILPHRRCNTPFFIGIPLPLDGLLTAMVDGHGDDPCVLAIRLPGQLDRDFRHAERRLAGRVSLGVNRDENDISATLDPA
jgi:hypothetical protein